MDNIHERTEAITVAAGAGFRLSLVLNAVKMKMQNADNEIQSISKGISDFSLMLKQVGRTMEEGGGIHPTPLVIDTVSDIKDHSEHIFEEVKSMTELAQVRDEQGNLTEIGIGQKIVWCFKQQKVPYLLGQLEYLKLNLAIVLQVLQLAKVVSPLRSRPSDKKLMQERAEIQNMIVLQHWSFEGLKTLFANANEASRRDSITSTASEDPPPKYDDPPAEEVRLAIKAPPVPPKEEEDTSKAMVKYQEKPVQQLDDSLHQALNRENQVLSAQVPDIVNHLLREWTIPEYPTHRHHRSDPRRIAQAHVRPSKAQNHHPTVSSGEEDTTESEYDTEPRPKGFYLEGPAPKPPAVKKKLRFKDQQPQVESDSDEDDHRSGRRTSGRHILRSEDDSSDSDLSSSPDRRDPVSGNDISPPSAKSYDRKRRPYTSGPSAPRNSPPEKEAVRSRAPYPQGMPSSPRQGPVPVHIHQHGQPSNLRPPHPAHHQSHPGAYHRPSQGNPALYNPAYGQSPNASPVMTHGQWFPQQQQQPAQRGMLSPASTNMPREKDYFRERERSSRPKGSHSQHSSYESKGSYSGSGARKDRSKDASRNIKKGIGIGAAAAGLMELLSGLDAI